MIYYSNSYVHYSLCNYCEFYLLFYFISELAIVGEEQN